MLENTAFGGADTATSNISEKEAARFLGISESTIKRIRYAGKINFYRIGRRVFYSYPLLKTFLEKCVDGGVE